MLEKQNFCCEVTEKVLFLIVWDVLGFSGGAFVATYVVFTNEHSFPFPIWAIVWQAQVFEPGGFFADGATCHFGYCGHFGCR